MDPTGVMDLFRVNLDKAIWVELTKEQLEWVRRKREVQPDSTGHPVHPEG